MSIYQTLFSDISIQLKDAWNRVYVVLAEQKLTHSVASICV